MSPKTTWLTIVEEEDVGGPESAKQPTNLLTGPPNASSGPTMLQPDLERAISFEQ
jgi:hypothetical protein